MNSLIDIQSQIEKLQKQAADIKSREFDKTVLDIRAKMQAFGITIKDLQSAAPKGRKSKGKAAGAGVVKAAATKRKVGLKPRWLAALLAEGRTKEEFAI